MGARKMEKLAQHGASDKNRVQYFADMCSTKGIRGPRNVKWVVKEE
jgi:hypothetical protein